LEKRAATSPQRLCSKTLEEQCDTSTSFQSDAKASESSDGNVSDNSQEIVFEVNVGAQAQSIDIEQLSIDLAIAHHENAIMRIYGFCPWWKLICLKRLKVAEIERSRKVRIMLNCILVWRRNVESMVKIRKRSLAEKKVMALHFQEWQKIAAKQQMTKQDFQEKILSFLRKRLKIEGLKQFRDGVIYTIEKQRINLEKRRILTITDRILEELNCAREWGNYDMKF